MAAIGWIITMVSLVFHTDSPALTFLLLKMQPSFSKINLEIHLFGTLTAWKSSYFCSLRALSSFPLPLQQSSQHGYGMVKAIGLVGQNCWAEATSAWAAWLSNAVQFWFSLPPFLSIGLICSMKCRVLPKQSQIEAAQVLSRCAPILAGKAKPPVVLHTDLNYFWHGCLD